MMLNAIVAGSQRAVFFAVLPLLFFVTPLIGLRSPGAQEPVEYQRHLVEPGDTWPALGWQYGASAAALLGINFAMNPYRQPAITSELLAPEMPGGVLQTGRILRLIENRLLEFSLLNDRNPWAVSITNDLPSPRHPTFKRHLYLSDSLGIPRELPETFETLVFQTSTFLPGRALAFMADRSSIISMEASLGGEAFALHGSAESMTGILGTGAFLPPGYHDFQVSVDGQAIWTQPILFRPGDWSYEEITLTGTAAAIDQQSILEEWERLSAIWNQVSSQIMWNSAFRLPLDSFLEFSSPYGAHRSYNGGPFRSYHEGVDFAAYEGTPVLAPASGVVVLAEQLYVRGGAVLIDHGYGVFSGLYHMSSVNTRPGESVAAGQFVGEVGSTGLSTGNHLHWDLIIGGTQVDGRAWLESNTACWILEAFDDKCG